LRKNAVEGAQTVARTSQLLRLVARNGAQGARLLDLSRSAQLSQPTARRLLKALVSERLLRQPVAGGRYYIGPLAYELGLAFKSWPILSKEYREAMAHVADVADGAVCLQVFSGTDVLCLYRVDSNPSLRDTGIKPGDRRPLGGGGGPLALLATLNDSQVQHALESNQSELYFSIGVEARDMETAVASARHQGFAVSAELYDDWLVGIGIAVEAREACPTFCYSISILVRDVVDDHANRLAKMLKLQIKDLDASGIPCFKDYGGICEFTYG
jgi:DNA-binding IclR family transcriptional regulator